MVVYIYNDFSYHLLSSIGWIMYHGVKGSEFSVVDTMEGGNEGNDWILSHVRRGLDE